MKPEAKTQWKMIAFRLFFVQAAWPLVKLAMTTPHTPPAIGYTISCHVALPGTRVSRMCACRQPVAMRHSA